jgi:hypothetical protein
MYQVLLLSGEAQADRTLLVVKENEIVNVVKVRLFSTEAEMF